VFALWKDDKVTGAVPKNEAERDAFYRQGKLPYSVKVNDTYYSFRRFEPFNVPISQAISAFEEIEKGLLDEATETEIMTNLVGNFVDNAIDGSYTEGLQNVFVPYKR